MNKPKHLEKYKNEKPLHYIISDLRNKLGGSEEDIMLNLKKIEKNDPEKSKKYAYYIFPDLWICENLIDPTSKEQCVLQDIQIKALRDVKQHMLFSGGRQTGKSYLLRYILIYITCFYDTFDDYVILYITPRPAQLTKVIEDIKYICEANDIEFKKVKNDSGNTSLINCSIKRADSDHNVIVSFSSVQDSKAREKIRGQTIKYVLEDESGFIDDSVNQVILPTTSSYQNHYRHFKLSTKPLAFNNFYRMCLNPENYKNWAIHKFSSFHSPYFNKEHFEQLMLDLTPEQIDTEIMCDKYSKSDLCVFPLHLISYALDHELPGTLEIKDDDFNDLKYESKFIGVDWNSVNKGITICIIGEYIHNEKPYIFIVDRHIIKNNQYNNSYGRDIIIELCNEHDVIGGAFDKGYGEQNLEELSKLHAEGSFDHYGSIHMIRSNEIIHITDPYGIDSTKRIELTYKNKMINDVCTYLRKKSIIIPKKEDTDEFSITKCMATAKITKYYDGYKPVYGFDKPDHMFDAFALAVFAYNEYAVNKNRTKIYRKQKSEKMWTDKINNISFSNSI